MLLRHRAGLIFLGLILFLLTLELSLRLGGVALSLSREIRNKISLARKAEIRIICFGESTTALGAGNSYPAQLERILNQRSGGVRFSVINAGATAINTSYIVANLETALARYKPDLVITMMGINDYGLHMRYAQGGDSWAGRQLGRLRIYKLGRLLWLSVLAGVERRPPALKKNPPATGGTDVRRASSLVEWGYYYRSRGEPEKAEEMFKEAIALSPLQAEAYVGLAKCFRDNGEISRAEEAFRRAIELDPSNDAAYVGLGWCLRDQEELPSAEEAFRKALSLDPLNDDAAIGVAWCHRDRGEWSQAEEAFDRMLLAKPQLIKDYISFGWENKALEESALTKVEHKKEIIRVAEEFEKQGAQSDILCGFLAYVYSMLGREKEAAAYYQKANTIRESYYVSQTRQNYRKLKAMLDKKRIPLVCVQYPMRNIAQLRKMFDAAEDIVFVDNEKVFKDAVKLEGYGEYFIDTFAGDFGHCTPKGNRLLAENIADALQKEGLCR